MTVIAETDRLFLRVFEPADRAALFQMLGSRETVAQLPGALLNDPAEADSLIEERRAHQAANGYSIWATVLRASGCLVGNCGFRGERQDVLELGYLIDHRHWQRGYATEAASAAIAYGFGELRAPWIIATIRTGNDPSIAVAERLGMRQVESTADARGELLVFRLDP